MTLVTELVVLDKKLVVLTKERSGCYCVRSIDGEGEHYTTLNEAFVYFNKTASYLMNTIRHGVFGRTNYVLRSKNAEHPLIDNDLLKKSYENEFRENNPEYCAKAELILEKVKELTNEEITLYLRSNYYGADLVESIQKMLHDGASLNEILLSLKEDDQMVEDALTDIWEEI